MNYVFAKRLKESSANFRNKNYYTENELDIFTCSLVRKMRWLNERKKHIHHIKQRVSDFVFV